MALFFDAAWFDAKLSQTGLSRADLARALGLSQSDMDAVWKDQHMLSEQNVRILSALLAVPPEEIARHAGIATPVPAPDAARAADDRLRALEARIATMERQLKDIEAALLLLTAKR